MARRELPDVAAAYAENLLANEDAMTWLADRGLEPRTVFAAQLGFVREPLLPDHERMVGTLSIPYHDALGRVRSFRFRRLVGEPKYDTPQGTQGHLYRVASSVESRVYVAEGEFDTLILEQMGYAAVGVPGAQAFKSHWRYLFDGTTEVVLVFDGDDAGETGAERVREALGKGIRTRRVTMPNGLDVTDLYLADAVDLERRLT